jgi:site-specific DNA-methyltransferase (adenine-specific)
MKQRASNNRTLILEDAERPSLRAMFKTVDDLQQGQPLPWLDAIICADMMEAMRWIPDEMADLIILDPPYNLSRNFGETTFVARKEEMYEEYLCSWMHDVCNKLKPTGSLYLCGDWRCTAAMQRVLSKELTILNRITWQREKGRGARNNWKNSMEDIWFAVKDPQQYYFNVEAVMMKRRVKAPYKVNGSPKDWEETKDGNFRLTYPSNFWDDISVPFWSMPENTDHPTQKPEKLIAKLILASSKKGDVVFDPFMGSGTSCVVASKLGRHFCGIEQNEEYCLWAQKRLLLAKEDPSIQGFFDGVFWERNTNPRG